MTLLKTHSSKITFCMNIIFNVKASLETYFRIVGLKTFEYSFIFLYFFVFK